MTQMRKYNGMNLTEWGKRYGLSKERVRQLRNKWGTLSDDLFKNRRLAWPKKHDSHIKLWKKNQPPKKKGAKSVTSRNVGEYAYCRYLAKMRKLNSDNLSHVQNKESMI
tara:strand:- start:213 stop:539 length:327 start_codon:yes stop_codon:yes gene_type:complete